MPAFDAGRANSELIARYCRMFVPVTSGHFQSSLSFEARHAHTATVYQINHCSWQNGSAPHALRRGAQRGRARRLLKEPVPRLRAGCDQKRCAAATHAA